MKLILLAALFSVCGFAESICGKSFSTPDAELIEVACVDYDELRKVLGPYFGFSTGKVTQIRIYPKYGDVAKVVMGGAVKYTEIIKFPDGRLGTMATFDGMEYTDLPAVSFFSANCK